MALSSRDEPRAAEYAGGKSTLGPQFAQKRQSVREEAVDL
jgi:hypothetical protein